MENKRFFESMTLAHSLLRIKCNGGRRLSSEASRCVWRHSNLLCLILYSAFGIRNGTMVKGLLKWKETTEINKQINTNTKQRHILKTHILMFRFDLSKQSLPVVGTNSPNVWICMQSLTPSISYVFPRASLAVHLTLCEHFWSHVPI